MPTWHEDDRFWETFAPAMFGAETMGRAAGDVDGVLELSGTAAGARVLDLCCGPGRHSLELARRGFAVTGVDRTQAYLQRARESAAEEGLSVEFVLADAREFARSGAFDLAINLYSSFGYFEDPEDDRTVARNLAASLKPGGKLVMDLMSKEVLARVLRKRGWTSDGDMFMLQECEVCDDWTWISNRWILVKDGRTTERRVSHRIYSASELKALLRECGFAEVIAYGSLAGGPYDEMAARLVLVASRASA